MALLSNAGSFPPIKFSYLENEFGANGSRSLGAYYVLAGLTLVNNEAAEAMPWLYHSVVHI